MTSTIEGYKRLEPAWDVAANNYLLSLAGEEYVISPLRAARMKIWFKFESTPVFQELLDDRTFLYERFMCFTHAQLMQRCKTLDIKYRLHDNKRVLIEKLVAYWRDRLELTSRGRWQNDGSAQEA